MRIKGNKFNLNDNQKKFAEMYVISLNASDAYRQVYGNVKDNTAWCNGSKLLNNPNVKAYIDTIMPKDDGRRIAKAEEVMEYLTRMMRGEEVEEVVSTESKKDGSYKPVKVTKIPGAKDRLKAAELLGKRYRLFTEKIELETDGRVTIVNDIPVIEEENND